MFFQECRNARDDIGRAVCVSHFFEECIACFFDDRARDETGVAVLLALRDEPCNKPGKRITFR